MCVAFPEREWNRTQVIDYKCKYVYDPTTYEISAALFACTAVILSGDGWTHAVAAGN